MKTIKNPLTGRAAAELFGVSPDTVSRWCRDGLPHTGGGQHGTPLQIDLRPAMRWLTSRKTRKAESEQERLSGERADAVALQNFEIRAGLVMAEHVRQAVQRLTDELDAALALPDGLVERIAQTQDPALIRSILLDWSRSARSDYAGRIQPQ